MREWMKLVEEAQGKSPPLLIMVHPGSGCGSADDMLGRSQANAERDGLILELDNWEGGVLIVDSGFSDELPRYPRLKTAIDTALHRAKAAGMLSGRIVADDETEDNWSAKIPAALKQAQTPTDTVIFISGVWYWENDRAGCVNATYDAVKASGFPRVIVSDYAVVDPYADEDDE